MKIVQCDQCDLPRTSFIGPEKKPLANFCDRHGRQLTKANLKQRGRILESVAIARDMNKLVRNGHCSVRVIDGENTYSLTDAGMKYVREKLLKGVDLSPGTKA